MRTEPDVRDCLCLHLRKSARQVTQFYDRQLRPSGLRATQFTLLAMIDALRPGTQQPLADLLGMDRTTLTRNLALLQRAGYVRLEAGKDRREHNIRLTSGGNRILAAAMPLWQTAQHEMRRRIAARRPLAEPDTDLQVIDRFGELAQK